MESCKNCINKVTDVLEEEKYECYLSGHDITDRVLEETKPPKCTEYVQIDTKTPSLFE